MGLKLTEHDNMVKQLIQYLNASGGYIPFDKAQKIAQDTVKTMVTTYSRIDRSSLTQGMAWHRFVVYFHYSYPGVGCTKTILAALGYDYRHWVTTFGWPNEPEIPWRLFLCECSQMGQGYPSHPYLPPRVEERIQICPPSWSGWPMRDGFTLVFSDNSYKGQDYPFIRIPKKALEQVPSNIGHPDYVPKLADAVFNFLEDLFKPIE